MKWLRFAVYSSELIKLRDYLRNYVRHGLDPFDFAGYLDEYFKEMGTPQEYTKGEAGQYLEQMSDDELLSFKNWLDREKERIEEKATMNPLTAPSYLYMNYKKMAPHGTWLVHFSDEASDISREGFTKGQKGLHSLHVTPLFESPNSPGWNFAFLADSEDAEKAADSGKYGQSAVLFMSAGVEVWHHGDEENQVIFQGQGVKNSVPISKEGEKWVVEPSDYYSAGTILFEGSFRDVVEWVKTNYVKYRRFWNMSGPPKTYIEKYKEQHPEAPLPPKMNE